LQHPAITQRHQIRLPSCIGGAKDANRVGSIRSCSPSGVRVPAHGVA
jgi:hypothetical protein